MQAPKLQIAKNNPVAATPTKTPEPLIDTPASLLEASLSAPTPPSTSNSMISALLGASVALIAVAAWFFLSDLFTDHSASTQPPLTMPVPITTAKVTDSPFVSTDEPSQPEILLPDMATGGNADPPRKPSAEVALEKQPENAEPNNITDDSNATNTQPVRQSSPIKLSPAVAQRTQNLTKPALRVEAPVVTKTVPSPRVIVPEPQTVVAESNVRAAPIVSNTSPRAEIDNVARQVSSDVQAETRTSDSRNADTAPPEAVPVIAFVPPPETPSKKPTRRNSNIASSGLVVIVNKANSKIFSKSDISNIYRDRITRWPSGERILVFNLPLDSGENERFATAVLDMTSLSAAKEHSNRAITNRVQNEARTKNAQVIVSYIERDENAIGYVPAAAIADNDNVRVVFSIP